MNVNDWNLTHAIGVDVRVEGPDGPLFGRTTSAARTDASGNAVVDVDGVAWWLRLVRSVVPHHIQRLDMPLGRWQCERGTYDLALTVYGHRLTALVAKALATSSRRTAIANGAMILACKRVGERAS